MRGTTGERHAILTRHTHAGLYTTCRKTGGWVIMHGTWRQHALGAQGPMGVAWRSELANEKRGLIYAPQLELFLASSPTCLDLQRIVGWSRTPPLRSWCHAFDREGTSEKSEVRNDSGLELTDWRGVLGTVLRVGTRLWAATLPCIGARRRAWCAAVGQKDNAGCPS